MKRQMPVWATFLCCIAVFILAMIFAWFPTKDTKYYSDGASGVTNNIAAGIGSNGALAPGQTAIADAVAEGIDTTPVVASDRKLIRRATVVVETTQFDEYSSWLREYVNQAGGYFESEEENNWSSDSRTLEVVIRIPVSELDGFLSSIAVEGNVISKRESQEDITQSYTDTDAHLESIRIEQKRLNELLEKAETVEEILAIEDRLSYVRYEIESYERQLRSYDNQIEYSVVHMDLTEVVKYSEVEPEGFLGRCVRELKEHVSWIIDFSQDVLVYLFGRIPSILIGTVVAFITTKVVKKFRVKRKKETGNGDAS